MAASGSGAGVNMEELERESFKRGAHIEVNLDDPGFRGSWYSGTVIRTITKRTRNLYIEYDTLTTDDGSQPLREHVNAILARPSAPRERVRTFKMGEEVDAYHDDGWWEGFITKVHEGDRFTVFFKPSKEEIVFSGSDLRLHREWVYGNWVPPLEEEEAEESDEDQEEDEESDDDDKE